MLTLTRSCNCSKFGEENKGISMTVTPATSSDVTDKQFPAITLTSFN